MKIRFEPFEVEIDVEPGTSVLEASLNAGVHINASCGGSGVCGKCRVKVLSGQFAGGESEKISAEDAAQGYRLACTTIPTSDLVIEAPVNAARDTAALTALAAGTAQTAKLIGVDELKAAGRFDPALAKVPVTVEPPSAADNISDVGRLLRGLRKLGESHFAFRFEAIRDLPDAWRQGNWTVTASIMRAATSTGKNQVIHVDAGDASQRNIAAAIDLGTTTVWAQFVDLVSGEILGAEGDFNAQIGYGEDVITRIMYARKDGGLRRLQEAAANSINEVLRKLARKTGVDLAEVNLATIAGNTTMTQLFLGVNPQYIRLDPYVPAAAYYPPVPAHQFGLAFNDHVPLLIFPAVASYVGGDVVAGVMGSGMHVDERLTLFIDLGTNGEVVVGNKDWMVCAAASAGPAFEGGGIKFGMRAAKGAIENFSVDPFTGEPSIVTVGRGRARGICGSGLIATVASMLMTGIIDERGKFNVDHPSDRLRVGEDGPEYVLVWRQDGALDRDITLTEPDMDNLIRAKGAMYAAYITLLDSVGLTAHDLDRVILAGGFGQSINIERAQIIGLLPELPPEKFTFVGNGSLLGARLVCMSNRLRQEVTEIVDKMTNFELSVAPKYMDHYMAAQFLPHTEANVLFPGVYGQIAKVRDMLRQV